MPRVVFNGNEVDQNFQIEDGVRRTLENYAIATVSAKVVELNYELLDEGLKSVRGTLDEKCNGIAQVTDCTYEIRGERVLFRRK